MGRAPIRGAQNTFNPGFQGVLKGCGLHKKLKPISSSSSARGKFGVVFVLFAGSTDTWWLAID